MVWFDKVAHHLAGCILTLDTAALYGWVQLATQSELARYSLSVTGGDILARNILGLQYQNEVAEGRVSRAHPGATDTLNRI